MLNHEEEMYTTLATKGDPVKDMNDGLSRVRGGGYVFIDDASFLTYNFSATCKVVVTKTGKFNNEWALGTRRNAPFAQLISERILVYRESGYLASLYSQYVEVGAGACPRTVGVEEKFDLHILSGLYLVLAVGVVMSGLLVLVEMVWVSHRDAVLEGKGFRECLRRRLELKRKEVVEEWLGIVRKEREESEEKQNGGRVSKNFVAIEDVSVSHRSLPSTPKH